jgi:DNA-binding Lrp family transcriptional regulator
MVTAIVHIETQVDMIDEVAQAVAEIDGVSEVYSITGDYDLLAMVRVAAYEQVAEVIPGRINKVPGVLATDTHLAFRTYSRHDLEAAFSIGLTESD